MTAAEESPKAEPFERAKLPMILAAVGVAGGLAIAGSVDQRSGGAIVLAAWVLGIASLHRLGRAGSLHRPQSSAEGRSAAPAARDVEDTSPDE